MVLRATFLITLSLLISSAVARAELVREIRPDDATGTSAAVIVDRSAYLVHTSQLLPVGADGKTIASGGAIGQAEALLDRLESVLSDAGSSLEKLVKVDVYLASADVYAPFQKVLATRIKGKVRPAVTYVVGGSPRADAVVSLDAVALTSASDFRSHGRVSVLAPGPRIYVAGQASADTDLARATTKTLAQLDETLKFLNVDRSRVVRLKAFMQPMTAESVASVEKIVSEFFAGSVVPPLTLVAWQSPRDTPIEIELVASGRGPLGPAVEYLTPPSLKASPLYSRVARVGEGSLIYLSGLYGTAGTIGAAEVESIFNRLGGLLTETGSDMRHLVKATYYVSQDASSRVLNQVRPRYYDPTRPPAASKAFVAGVGASGQSIVVDMIGVTRAK